ncbi:type VI secretion system baseplate subunit TssK [Nostoc ellipsosporum NOK]|nr:type VI secretion system baseplate subunit TssK [Nostoc ellipsosporum NOK]
MSRLHYFPVNWVDGMKINKDHFIAQDKAAADLLYQSLQGQLSPIRYGILADDAGNDSFQVSLTADNQHTLKATVLQCRALTRGGIYIEIPSKASETLSATFTLSPQTKTLFYVVLVVNPFDRQPAGDPDPEETPPRYPFTQPSYQVELADEARYRQFAANPFALTIGRVQAEAHGITVDEEYIPPCMSLHAHADLLQLHSELDQFLGGLELRCSQIVQKIFRKSQQNDLSELALFLCDRIMLQLGQSLTQMRRTLIYESPAALFVTISSLARVMKNTIDLRIGSGKDELMNYLSEWCELNQGELESLLTSVANLPYDHNNVNDSIAPVIRFARVISRLFETLSNLEFIGKRKETGIFVKEEIKQTAVETTPAKTKRRFFG